MPNPAIRRHRTYAQAAGGGLSDADAYAAKMLTYSPWAYYKLNEASGTNVVDYGSVGGDGTHAQADIAGATTGPDGVSPAPLYIASDSNVTNIYTPELAAVFTLDDITIPFFYRYDGNWAVSGVEFFIRVLTDTSNFVTFQKSAANTATASLRYSGTTVDVSVNVATAGLNDGNIHHGCIVLDATGGSIELYIDGVSRGTGAHGGAGATGLLSGFVTIGGSRFSAPGGLLNGSLTELAFIPSVLGSAAVGSLATYGA